MYDERETTGGRDSRHARRPSGNTALWVGWVGAGETALRQPRLYATGLP